MDRELIMGAEQFGHCRGECTGVLSMSGREIRMWVKRDKRSPCSVTKYISNVTSGSVKYNRIFYLPAINHCISHRYSSINLRPCIGIKLRLFDIHDLAENGQVVRAGFVARVVQKI